jgi:hypothetical protein
MSARDPPVGTDHHPLARPDHSLAPSESVERADRSGQQPDQTCQAGMAFGITNFANYRIRALLYAGRPNWNLLATVTPYWGGMTRSRGWGVGDLVAEL